MFLHVQCKRAFIFQNIKNIVDEILWNMEKQKRNLEQKGNCWRNSILFCNLECAAEAFQFTQKYSSFNIMAKLRVIPRATGWRIHNWGINSHDKVWDKENIEGPVSFSNSLHKGLCSQILSTSNWRSMDFWVGKDIYLGGITGILIYVCNSPNN